MATVNFSVPDEVKEAFNETFKEKNKSAIIADLMREAVEREQRKQRSREAIDRILARHARTPIRSDERLQTVRKAGRL